MKIELNDETLTAYALGELDAAETKAVEKLLAEAARAGNDAPRKALEEIRAAAKFAEEAFAETNAEAALTGEQREAVEAQVTKTRPIRWGRALALAAGIVLIATAFAVSRLDDTQLLDLASQVGIGKAKEKLPYLYMMEDITPLAERGTSIPDEMRQQMKALGYSDPSADGLASERMSRISSLSVENAPAASPSVSFNAEDLSQLSALGYASGGAGGGISPGAQLSVSSPRTVEELREGVGAEQYVERRTRINVQQVPPGQLAAAAAPAPASETQLREQLKSLGYVDEYRDVQTPVLGDSTTVGLRFQTTRADVAAPYYRSQPAPVTSPGTEAYAPIADAPFVRVADQPLSTFSIDVDTASYSNVRRFLQDGQLPPPNAVRVEELINYFDYAYPAPADGRPFAAHFEAAACPWAPEHTLVRIGLKGREVPRAERPASNLVFLIDVSGSMQASNKLPLVKRAMAMLTSQLDERDRVAIVTYASGVEVKLRPTNGSRQDIIQRTIEGLFAGGSTNGAGGIQLAYESARRNFLPGGVNRVILATDGDFNVGISDNDSLLQLIQQEAKSGVFLSVFGFGMGNLKDDKLELLADKGNGVYGYIDSDAEARKVFVEKLSGTLVTIAKDVKIQVEFNPARAAAYRLVGYENRALAAQDFNDDRKDAGEIGAGHTVTALYEVVPAGMAVPAGSVDTLRYQTPAQETAAPVAASIAPPAHTDELLLVKLRYKEPEGAVSQLLEFPLKDQKAETMSADLKFASAVAAFGKSLRGNQLGAALSYDGMMQLAQAGLAGSADPQRSEMIHLMLTARPMLEVRWEVPVAAAEISLVNLRQVNGEWRARLQTQSRTSWYQIGEEFENYRLLAIVPETGCAVVFVERTQETITICLSVQ